MNSLYQYLDEIPGPDIDDPEYDYMRHFTKPEYLCAGHNVVNVPADPDPYEGQSGGMGLTDFSKGVSPPEPGLIGKAVNQSITKSATSLLGL